MTKTIRIENADTSNWKVDVLVQDKQYNKETGVWDGEWVTTEKQTLNHPTQLMTHYITSSRRLIIQENGV